MKINERQIHILKIMLANEYTTVSDIESKLRISDKTIRNEIKRIKEAFPSSIIAVKGKGYYLENREQIEDIIQSRSYQNENHLLSVFNYILTHSHVDYYQLADECYISESTLDNDIQTLNQLYLQKYHTQIVRKNNYVFLDCDEGLRRKIYTLFLMNEIENYNFDVTKYSDYFQYARLDELQNWILEFLKHHAIKLTDMEILSLIIHISILIDRVKGNNSLKQFSAMDIDKNSLVLIDLCNELVSRYQLELNEAEINYIGSLLFSRMYVVKHTSVVDDKLLKFIDDVLLEVLQYYQIDLLADVELKNNFLVHLVALQERFKLNRKLTNPMIKEIKNNFPLIYDISVFISMKVQEYLKIHMEEDEIGFITLHLMCSVEKMRNEQYRIAIIDPLSNKDESYYGERLGFHFPHITFQLKCFSLFELAKLEEYQPTLIISTTSIKKQLNVPYLFANPLMLSSDIEQLKQILTTIKLSRQKSRFALSQFDPQLFFADIALTSKAEIIHFMCDALCKAGYCDEGYEELVMERERIAPTSFGNLYAIPHPVRKLAHKSGIAIGILRNPIDWSGQKVRLVFLFSLAPENKDLMKLYESIVALLDDTNKVKRLIKQSDFDAFIEEFIS